MALNHVQQPDTQHGRLVSRRVLHLGQHLAREQLQVRQVGQVQDLQVHGGRAGLGEFADPGDDLRRRAGQAIGA